MKLNESRSQDSSTDDLRRFVAVEYQTCNELIPGARLSDHAAKIMLDSLEEIARTIGKERFHEMIVRAIETCDRRPTLATYRKLAGLNSRLGPQEEALAKAWELTTVILTRFLSHDAEGNAVIRPRISQRDGEYFEELPPEIPEGVRKAVAGLGGWKALLSSYPEWHSQRFHDFKELYRPSAEEQALLLAPVTKALAVTR
jgi:hypothetical protein